MKEPRVVRLVLDSRGSRSAHMQSGAGTSAVGTCLEDSEDNAPGPTVAFNSTLDYDALGAVDVQGSCCRECTAARHLDEDNLMEKC